MENVSATETIDYKVTKTHYALNNTDEVVEVVIPKDPNLFARKNKILIRGTVQVDPKFIPDCNWASKLFSQLFVEVESQLVSKNTTR